MHLLWLDGVMPLMFKLIFSRVSVFSFSILLCFSLSVFSSESIHFKSDDIDYHFADFNGDKAVDLLLKSNHLNGQSFVVYGAHHTPVLDININAIRLDKAIPALSLNPNDVKLLAGNFTADKYSDTWVFNKAQGTALLFSGSNQGLNLTPSVTLNGRNLPFLNHLEQYDITRGDFNGDNIADIFLQAKASGKNGQPEVDHLIYLSDPKTGELQPAFTIPKQDKKWTRAFSNPILRDFNNDNRTDIFLQSNHANNKHYLFLADDSSGFDLNNPTVIKEKVNGKDWNTQDYTLTPFDVDGDGKNELVRRPKAAAKQGQIEPTLCANDYLAPLTGEFGITCHYQNRGEVNPPDNLNVPASDEDGTYEISWSTAYPLLTNDRVIYLLEENNGDGWIHSCIWGGCSTNTVN